MYLRIVRRITLTANSVLIIVGVAIFSLGIQWMSDFTTSQILSESIISNGSLTLFLGLFQIIGALFGFYTIFIKNVTLLAIHGVVLSSMAITHFCVGSVSLGCFFRADKLEPVYKTKLNDALYDAYKLNSTSSKIVLQHLQLQLECCGGYNYSDYSNYFKEDTFPATCCKEVQSGCTKPFKTGCIEAAVDKTKRNFEIAGILSFIASAVATIGAIFIALRVIKMHENLVRKEEMSNP